jgi:cell division protein ZapA
MIQPGSKAAMLDPTVVSVEIRGHRYPIRSALDAQYVHGLAAYVDEKMRAASESTPSGDSLRLAVLAALNIADELFRCQDAQQIRRGALTERYEALERLVDAALNA